MQAFFQPRKHPTIITYRGIATAPFLQIFIAPVADKRCILPLPERQKWRVPGLPLCQTPRIFNFRGRRKKCRIISRDSVSVPLLETKDSTYAISTHSSRLRTRRGPCSSSMQIRDADALHPDAIYRLAIDNDGDYLNDIAFSYVFSQPQNGKQTVSVFVAKGAESRSVEAVGNKDHRRRRGFLRPQAQHHQVRRLHLLRRQPQRRFLFRL